MSQAAADLGGVEVNVSYEVDVPILKELELREKSHLFEEALFLGAPQYLLEVGLS